MTAPAMPGPDAGAPDVAVRTAQRVPHRRFGGERCATLTGGVALLERIAPGHVAEVRRLR